MGACFVRFADRNQEGEEGIRRFPQEADGRWFHDVSVLDLSAPLPERRECRCPHKTGEEHYARVRSDRYSAHNRQAVWRDGDFLV